MTPFDNKMVIIVMGSPGAGKGTQASLLAEKFELYHWETSRVVGREIEKAAKGSFVGIEGKKFYFEKEKKLREKGKLWDPPFVVYLIKKKLKELAKEGRGVVLTGSPRTVYEGEKIVPLLKKLYGQKNIKVLLLEVTEKEVIWRNTRRRECELIRHPILYSKETAQLTKCPLDGSKLVSRVDDTPEAIRVRLKEYRKKTLPLIDLFQKEGLEVMKIDGSPPPADVFYNVLKVL
jgi:adenylate kinase